MAITTDVVVLLLVATMIMTITFAKAHGDDICMECPCGPGNCNSNSIACCDRFQTRTLHTFRVRVNCSRPGHSRIIDLVGLPYNFLHGSGNCSGFHVVHEHSCLTAIPENSCHYPATRAITLSNNALSVFPDLHCLAKLGKLDLRHNKLQAVPREAFKDLMYLREVYLDYNHITYIHTKAFDVDLTELSVFSVSHNFLLQLEAWPMTLHYRFCIFDFSHNNVQDFSNQAHWKLNTSAAVVYGPGFVNLTYNNLTVGPEDLMHELNIKSLLDMAKFMRWGFDFRYNPFHCDCQFYTIVFWAQIMRKTMMRNYFNVTCASPPQFKDVPVIDIPHDQLVCNITRDCPRGCRCQNQPSKNGIVIACNNVGMTSLPDVMARGDNLMLHLANNSLRQLPPRQYFMRAKTVDLRGNRLREIAKSTPHLLRNAEQIDLRHNDLHHLPETFQALEPKALLLDLHTLKCSCDLEWFPAWLQYSKDHHLNNITCQKEGGGHVQLITATRDDLGCNVDPDHSAHRTTLIVAFVVMIAVAFLLVIFRYEALVLAHSCAGCCAAQSKSRFPALLNEQRYDVFISLNFKSENDYRWVREVLVPALDRQGLTSYLPPRDLLPGDVEIDQVIRSLQESAAALVILSPDYLESASCIFQFKLAYSYMAAHRRGNLLLIRLSELPRRAVREPRLRAMLTLRMFYTPDPQHLDKALASLTQHQDTEL